MDVSELSKAFVTVSLICIFLWRSYISFKTLMNPPMVSSLSTECNKTLPFPDVTICPYYMKDPEFMPLAEGYKAMQPFNEVITTIKIGDLSVEDQELPNHAANQTLRQYIGGRGTVGCYTVESPNTGKPIGHLNEMKIVINGSLGQDQNLIFIHNRGFFISSSQNMFGGANIFQGLEFAKNASTKSNRVLTVTVKVDKHISVNRKERPCSDTHPETLSTCLERYYQRKLKCHLPWHKSGSKTMDVCNSTQQSDEYNSLKMRLAFSMNPEEVLQELDCNVDCEMPQYSLTVPEAQVLQSEEDLETLVFIIVDSSVTVTKELWMYNFNDFVADVGGFLGLLLGTGILQLYEILVSIARKMCTNT